MKKFENCLICTDIDGTLLNTAKQLDEPSEKAIRMFMAEGGRFSFATGRLVASFESVKKKLIWNAPVVFANGAQIYDYGREEMLWQRELEPAYYDYLMGILYDNPGVCLEAYGHLHCEAVRMNEISLNHCMKFGFKFREYNHLNEIPGTLVKTLYTGERSVLEAIQARIGREHPELNAVFSNPLFLEVFSGTVNKGTGARRLASLLSPCPTAIYTAGDQENDLDLLRAATLSFAPANAVPSVRAQADVILPDNDHNTMAALIDYIGQTL